MAAALSTSPYKEQLGFRSLQGVWSESCVPGGEQRQGTRRDKSPGDS